MEKLGDYEKRIQQKSDLLVWLTGDGIDAHTES